MTHAPRSLCCREPSCDENRWKKTILVIWAISHRSAFATTALIAPTGNAKPMRTSMRESVRKSPSKVDEVLSPDITCGAPENGLPLHFRHCRPIGNKFDNFLLVRAKHAEFLENFHRDFAKRAVIIYVAIVWSVK